MKASLQPKQAKALAAIGAVLVVSAALAWFGLGQLGEKQAEWEALTQKMAEPALAALLSDPSGTGKLSRDLAEIQKLETRILGKDGSWMKDWAAATAEASGEGQDWSKDPGKWKDRLIFLQSDLQKKATEHQVKLAQDFYLGLEAYRQKSPAASAVPGLALDLSIAHRLVEKLFAARETPEQYKTVCGLRSLTVPEAATEKDLAAAAAPPPGPRPAAVKGPERRKYRLEIDCSPEVLYAYVHLLARDNWPFLVTDLAVRNQKKEFPLRSEIAKKFSSDEAPGASKEKKLLEILAGDESLLVTLDVDFVVWPAPSPGNAKNTQGKKP